MAREIWNMPSGRSRRWGRRKDPRPRMPRWSRYTMTILALAVCTTLIWTRTARYFNPARRIAPLETSNAVIAGQGAAATWQRDVASSLETAIREARAGKITQGEVGIDRAAAIVTAAKFRADQARPGFFGATDAQLDRAVAAAPENARLAEHATMMRIELAQLRSAMESEPADSRSMKKVAVNSPRSIPRDFMLDPESLGGTFLDATLMPSSAEILEPPSSRLFVDNVRVKNLTLAGAAQTLDGIHWRDVTFMGTRLRYQGGEVALQNVHFVRCTFGFANGDRSARLATAIALGQTSIVIP